MYRNQSVLYCLLGLALLLTQVSRGFALSLTDLPPRMTATELANHVNRFRENLTVRAVGDTKLVVVRTGTGSTLVRAKDVVTHEKLLDAHIVGFSYDKRVLETDDDSKGSSGVIPKLPMGIMRYNEALFFDGVLLYKSTSGETKTRNLTIYPKPNELYDMELPVIEDAAEGVGIIFDHYGVSGCVPLTKQRTDLKFSLHSWQLKKIRFTDLVGKPVIKPALSNVNTLFLLSVIDDKLSTLPPSEIEKHVIQELKPTAPSLTIKPFVDMLASRVDSVGNSETDTDVRSVLLGSYYLHSPFYIGFSVERDEDGNYVINCVVRTQAVLVSGLSTVTVYDDVISGLDKSSSYYKTAISKLLARFAAKWNQANPQSN